MKKIIKKYKELHIKYKFLAALTFFVLLGVVFGFLYRTTDCGTDKQCFNDLTFQCKRAQVKTLVDVNLYEFETLGTSLTDFEFDKCRVDVKVLSVETADLSLYNLFKDTKMTCRVPKGEIKEFTDLKDILKHCHGSLKEALYEKVIREMYTRIIRNLEVIAVQASKSLTGVGL